MGLGPLLAAFAVASAALASAQPAIPTPRIVDVQWPPAPPFMGASVDGERIAGSEIPLFPVLIPAELQQNKKLTLVADPLNYTASARQSGATITMAGTRIAVDVPGSPPVAPAAVSTGSGIEVEFSEGRVMANMVRYGVAYSLTIECSDREDPRCLEEAEARRLLEASILAGGSQADAASVTLPATPFQAGLPMMAAHVPPPGFAHHPPGELIPGSGRGVVGQPVHAPGIQFPVERLPAYLNSQVWNIGGRLGPEPNTSWKDKRNYAYPWRDNFCETRGYRTPSCPGGTGHQGVDIRPSDPRNNTHWAVAVEDGRIHSIGPYSVTLVGRSGTRYTYLHMNRSRLAVKVGQTVTRGQRMGLVSNEFNGTKTPVHLHFEIKQNINGNGITPVPPYSSLVEAYGR